MSLWKVILNDFLMLGTIDLARTKIHNILEEEK